MKRRSLLLAAAVAAVAIIGSVGTALAVIPGDAPTIAACVLPSGQLRVPDGSCGQNEQATTLATASGLNGLSARLDALEAKVTRLEGANTDLEARVSALESDNADLERRVGSLEGDTAGLKSRFDGVTRDGDTLRFSGMNVQVVNGMGQTHLTNGLGNLIIGYAANAGSFNRDGSHNLVIGDDNGWSSFGGLVAGTSNQVVGASSAVTGGHDNVASGFASSVSGGAGNTASGDRSSVTGGSGNTASGDRSSVSGGGGNTASGNVSSLLGGHDEQLSQFFGTFPGGALSGYRLVSSTFTVGGSQSSTRTASCPAGTKILGGGAWLFTTPNAFDITPKMIQSAPISDSTWEVKIDNLGSARSWDYSLQLTCAPTA